MDNGQPVTADVTITSAGTNKYNVSISSNVNGSAVVLLDSDDVNDVIDTITILNGCCSADQLILTIRKYTSEVERSSIQGIERIRILNPTGTHVRIAHLVIDGDLGTGAPIDSINTSDIDLIDITGDLLGNVIINNQASAVTSNTDLIKIGGDMFGGGIYNNTGSITSIEVDGSALPDSGDNPEIWSSGSVDGINVVGSFEGRIGSNSEGFSGHPDVGSIEVGGDFDGTSAMTMNRLDMLDVDGDFNAEITINSATSSAGFYDIAGDMSSAAKISLPSDGLEGQVIVNSGYTSNVWDGDVIVGSTTLAPNYTELSSELGGGQAGVAPFNFHQRTSAPGAGESRDCDPYHTEVVTAAYNPNTGKNDVISSVNIRHYGTVFADGAGAHFRVEFKSDVLPSSWVDRTSLFEIDTSVTGTSALTADRDAVIKGTVFNGNGFTAAGRWRIRPLSGKVKCGDASGNPDVVWDSNIEDTDHDIYGNAIGTTLHKWFTFRVLLQAPGGGNTLLQGGTNASDVSAWMESPYEVNADGETNSTDFVEVAESLVSE